MKPNQDYCPSTNIVDGRKKNIWERVHDLYDMSYWNEQNHPACSRCTYIDKTRKLKGK